MITNVKSETLQSIRSILPAFDLKFHEYEITPLGSGYIHLTFLLKSDRSYVLQRVNKKVFREPEIIANNLRLAADHIYKKDPEYKFLKAVPSVAGDQMVYDPEGFPWRIFPYFENTFTVDKVATKEQAFSAAAEFARLVRYLDDTDVSAFKETIPRFHDLELRYDQFLNAQRNPQQRREAAARDLIGKAEEFRFLVNEYRDLIAGGMKLRVTHNDTKINNILFDADTQSAVCAIDLDTLMPGFVMYDIGDMIRTFVSEVDEEERDVTKVNVRPEIYRAISDGYLSQMGDRLNRIETGAIHFSGMMMTYIMALRMLTDYLNGDIYYQIRYSDQNLVRARNQFKLLDLLSEFAE